jgi:surfactin synthase thioesterase subunit
MGGIPEVLRAETELLELLMPTIRADLEMGETWISPPGPPVDIPISVFGGVEDDAVSRDDLAGWTEHTTRGITLALYPGDHFYLQAHEGELLSALATGLAPFRPAQKIA